MDRKPVESSSIRSIGYAPDSEAIDMEFNSGAVYQYQGVNQISYDMLMAASSKGGHFITHVRACFVGHRVHAPNCESTLDCWCRRQMKYVTVERNLPEEESKKVK